MKKLGVLLVLLVFGSILVVGTSTEVSATTLVNLFSVNFASDTSLVDTYSWTSWSGDIEQPHWFLDAIVQSSKGAIGYNSTKKAFYLTISSAGNSGHYRARVAVLKKNITVSSTNLTVRMTLFAETGKGAAVGAIIFTKSGVTYSVMHYEGANWQVGTNYGSETMGKLAWADNDYRFDDLDTSVQNSFTTVEFRPFADLAAKGVNLNVSDVTGIEIFFGGMIYSDVVQSVYLQSVEILAPPAIVPVTFSIKDALTGQGITGVTVKENGTVLGTVNDGDSIKLTNVTHTLTFSKDGYWSVTKTIDVENDTSVSVEMYPSSAAFKLENFPSDISIPENTIYTLTFTLSPIQTSATYNTYLSISGLQNLISVKKGGSVISPEDGKYYLGDISGPTQVSITFQAGAVGQHGFTLTLTSNDAIMSQTYTTTKQVVYQVEPLPFSVQMPSEWQVGQNELRISESSGQSYLITAVLKDSGGNEVWSDSYAFNPYDAHTFQVNIPSEGSYALELQFNGQTASYDIQVNPTITLKTKTLTVQKGSEGTIILHFKNPSSDVQYYTITVSGGFLPKAINQSISVAPATEKDVSIAFAVPEKLTYDAYELNVQVLQGNATVFSDKVAVSINSGGFSLFGGGSSGGKTLIYLLAGLIVVGVGVWALRRR